MELLSLLYRWKYVPKDNGDGGGVHTVGKKPAFG